MIYKTTIIATTMLLILTAFLPMYATHADFLHTQTIRPRAYFGGENNDPDSYSGARSRFISEPFSNGSHFDQAPNAEADLQRGLSLRAGPDLGGDIEGGGDNGIGREVPLPSLSIFTFSISFLLYILVWIVRSKRYSIRKIQIFGMMRKKLLPLLLITLFVSHATAQTPPTPVAGALYVKESPSGDGSGTDWNNAYDGKYLATYLRSSTTNSTVIYVAEGKYYPYLDGVDNAATARSYSFELLKSVKMYGGFANSAKGTDLSSYDPRKNVTRLSGDIGLPNDTTDNSLMVVKVVALTGSLIDGFYISGGNGTYTSGGGLATQNAAFLTLSNSVVEENYCYRSPDPPASARGGYGGGIYANYGLISNCIIRNNECSANGGGVYTLSNMTFENVTVSGNKSHIGAGAGLVVGGNITFKGDIVIERNFAAISHGGGMYIGTTNFDLEEMTSLKIVDCKTGGTGNGGGMVFAGITHLILDGSKADITIEGNEGFRGGAMSLNLQASVTLKNITVKDNIARSSGGVIYATGKAATTDSRSVVTLENATFENNVAQSGGVVYSNNYSGAATTSSLNIDKCTFIKNYATTAGGGVISLSGLAEAYIHNSTFSENEARGGNASLVSNSPGGGGAIKVLYLADAVSHGKVDIIACTFNGNKTGNNTGHAIDLGNPEKKTVNGNIIYGNGTGGLEMRIDAETALYNVEKGTTLQDPTNIHVVSGEGRSIFTDMGADDLAVLADNGGATKTYNIVKNGLAYNLIPLSLAEAWGLSATTTDQRDQLRQFGCKMDAGSVESQEIEDVMTYDVGSNTVCPDTSVDANTLITTRVNVKRIDYFSDAAYTSPLTMPITVDQAMNVYARVVSSSNCENDEVLPIGLFARESTWSNGGNDSDWNNSTNWSDGVPGPCTNVVIPSSKNEYPILDQTTDAVCDTIDFKFGGEVARTNYLEYNSAKVDLTLKSNQWYMLSPVLQQQYSGDYLEDAAKYRINPEIFIMYYQTDNPETGEGKVSSKFTGTFNNVDELLKMTSGHALWVDEGNRSESEFTIHFPKDSVRYAYYSTLNEGEITRFSDVMGRDKSDRFIYEGNSSYLTNGDGSFSQAIENSNLYPQLIIGNPYMSHLDIVEFQRENDSYLDKKFRIWKNGSSYEAYLIDGLGNVVSTDGKGENGFLIPPMQSFIADTKGPFSDALLFTPAMSVTQPNKTLRAAKEETQVETDVVNVEVLRKGVRQSGLALRYKADEGRHYNESKDVWTMIPENVGSYVSIYSLVDGGAASIYSTGDIFTPIDLGVSVGGTVKKEINKIGKEPFSIQIVGDPYLARREVFLIDKQLQVTHNLSQSAYEFDNTTGDVKDRFQLFASATISIDENQGNKVETICEGGVLNIISSTADPIESVVLYGIQGDILHKAVGLNQAEWTCDVSNQKIVIVKVQTKNTNTTRKIMTK